VSEEEFWRYYSEIEEAAHSSFEEFARSGKLFDSALEGIRGCLRVTEKEAKRLAERMGLNAEGNIVEVSWMLAKAHIISPKLLDDLEDVYAISQRVTDRLTIYSALIRSMEVIEALWSSVRSQLNNSTRR
jgi:hypothetical protein